jgi:hypothetical protein
MPRPTARPFSAKVITVITAPKKATSSHGIFSR